MDDRGTGDLVTLARGIVRATDKNARVVLVSAGVAAPSSLLEDAVAYARSRGSVVVAAAGNETLGRALYPARTKGVLGVAASRENHRLSLNTPLDGAIELAAPGDEILTTLPTTIGSGRGVMAGSSMSAAFVAGATASISPVLMMSSPGPPGPRAARERGRGCARTWWRRMRSAALRRRPG